MHLEDKKRITRIILTNSIIERSFVGRKILIIMSLNQNVKQPERSFLYSLLWPM